MPVCFLLFAQANRTDIANKIVCGLRFCMVGVQDANRTGAQLHHPAIAEINRKNATKIRNATTDAQMMITVLREGFT